jgi:hypothetical protein
MEDATKGKEALIDSGIGNPILRYRRNMAFLRCRKNRYLCGIHANDHVFISPVMSS